MSAPTEADILGELTTEHACEAFLRDALATGDRKLIGKAEDLVRRARQRIADRRRVQAEHARLGFAMARC